MLVTIEQLLNAQFVKSLKTQAGITSLEPRILAKTQSISLGTPSFKRDS